MQADSSAADIQCFTCWSNTSQTYGETVSETVAASFVAAGPRAQQVLSFWPCCQTLVVG